MVPPRLLFPFYLKSSRCLQNVGIDMYHLSQLGTGPKYRQIIRVGTGIQKKMQFILYLRSNMPLNNGQLLLIFF